MTKKTYSREELEKFRTIVDPKNAALRAAQPPTPTVQIPAHQELNKYPANKDVPLNDIKNQQKRRMQEFEREREIKLKELQEAKAKKLAEAKKEMSNSNQPSLLSGNQKELIWINGTSESGLNFNNPVVSPKISDKSSIEELEKEMEILNNEQFIIEENEVEESQTLNTSRLPNEGEYCVVLNGDILLVTESSDELKAFIVNLLQKDDTLELSNLHIMKRLHVSFELFVKE